MAEKLDEDLEIFYVLEDFSSMNEFEDYVKKILEESEIVSRIDNLIKFFAEQVENEQKLTCEISNLFELITTKSQISEETKNEDVIVVSDNLNEIKKNNKLNLNTISNSVVTCLAIGMKLMAQRSVESWSKATLIDIFNLQFPVPERTYKVRFDDNVVKTVGPKSISHAHSNMIISIGSRIICRYDPTEYKHYYSGIVAEVPCFRNLNRYLIFFEDGYAKYAFANDIQPVYYQSFQVWDDVNAAFGVFIKEYLEMFPDRPMVRLKPGLFIKTEYKGQWLQAMVGAIDCSLVEMIFEADKRSEWIYRGSTRLEPLFKGLAHVEELKSVKRGRRRTAPHLRSINKPLIEYTHNEDVQTDSVKENENFEGNNNVLKGQLKKTATERSSKNDNQVLGICESIKFDAILPVRLRSDQKKPCRRFCTPNCLGLDNDDPLKLIGKNPLSIPLLYGWKRSLVRKSARKRIIIYEPPCGKQLKSMDEIVNFLFQTKSNLTIDLFSSDAKLSIDNIFKVINPKIDIPDITYNEENVPIRCVNSFDESYPEFMEYSKERVASKDVNLNTDQSFLLCCDCTDNCRDRNKCRCMQLTVEATNYLPKNYNPKAGYQYKRLNQPVVTGIYECNKKCPCNFQCQNRVTQNGLKLRLLLFKTRRKGWGLCCLDDIPKGCFICVYAGQLLTDETATLDGKEYGDEYLAELDHIEVVEKMKEGYESDVIEDDDDDDGDDDDIDSQKKDKSDSDFEEDIGMKKKLSNSSLDNLTNKRRGRKVSSSPKLDTFENTKQISNNTAITIQDSNKQFKKIKTSNLNFYSRTNIMKSKQLTNSSIVVSVASNNAEYISIDSLMQHSTSTSIDNDLSSHKLTYFDSIVSTKSLSLNKETLGQLINTQLENFENSFCDTIVCDLAQVNKTTDDLNKISEAINSFTDDLMAKDKGDNNDDAKNDDAIIIDEPNERGSNKPNVDDLFGMDISEDELLINIDDELLDVDDGELCTDHLTDNTDFKFEVCRNIILDIVENICMNEICSEFEVVTTENYIFQNSKSIAMIDNDNLETELNHVCLNQNMNLQKLIDKPPSHSLDVCTKIFIDQIIVGDIELDESNLNLDVIKNETKLSDLEKASCIKKTCNESKSPTVNLFEFDNFNDTFVKPNFPEKTISEISCTKEMHKSTYSKKKKVPTATLR